MKFQGDSTIKCYLIHLHHEICRLTFSALQMRVYKKGD